MKPLNIIYMHCHDLGRFCEPYGYPIPSPNLQQLAEEGVTFRQAHSAAPTCSPSRAALLTGQFPHTNGMFGLASSRWGYTLNNYSQHMAAFLNEHGYTTALAGVQHEACNPFHSPSDMGYDHLLNHTATEFEDHDPKTTVSAALDFLAEDHEDPFFLSIGFLEPHRWNRGDQRVFSQMIATEPEHIDDRFCQPMPNLPDNPVTRREAANFRQGVQILDRKIGAILDAVKWYGYKDNTLIICTTDHGPGFPDMKKTLKDRGTGVMLIMRGPEWSGIYGGKVNNALVSQMDIYPTICELFNLEKPDYLQGESMVPLIFEKQPEIHDMIFTEQSYHGKYCPFRAVRTQRYKYIRCFDTDAEKGVDRGPAQILWEDAGWQDMPQPVEELYDLLFDPNEANNLADRPGNEKILEEMRSHLKKWMFETDDPITCDHGIPEPPAWKKKK